MGRSRVATRTPETGQVGDLRARSVIDALSSISSSFETAFGQVLGARTGEPRHLRKRERLEKRPAAAEKVKPQASGHVVAPEAPNYVEPG